MGNDNRSLIEFIVEVDFSISNYQRAIRRHPEHDFSLQLGLESMRMLRQGLIDDIVINE